MVKPMFRIYDIYLVAIFLMALGFSYANVQLPLIMINLGIGCLGYCFIRSKDESI